MSELDLFVAMFRSKVGNPKSAMHSSQTIAVFSMVLFLQLPKDLGQAGQCRQTNWPILAEQ